MDFDESTMGLKQNKGEEFLSMADEKPKKKKTKKEKEIEKQETLKSKKSSRSKSKKDKESMKKSNLSGVNMAEPVGA